MVDDDELPQFIDLALNEATWYGITLDADGHRVGLGFDALTLPEGTEGSGHAGVTLVLGGVSRLVVSLRLGRWDDEAAAVVGVSLDGLPEVVQSFGGAPIYGWEFFDLPEDSWERWAGRLSLDAHWDEPAPKHSLTLFKEGHQDGQARHLDCRFWFNALSAYDTERQLLPLDAFAAGGKRWWDGMYAGDERTRSSGVVPLKRDDADS